MRGILLSLTVGLLSTAGYGQSTIPGVGLDASYSLGQGFDSENRAFRETCLDGTHSFAGQSSSFLSFDRALQLEDIHHHVEAEFSGGVNFVLFGGKVTTNLTSIMHKNTYADTLVYMSSIREKTEIITPTALNATGQYVAGFKDLNFTKVQCGNEFVKEIHRGADLFISVDFNFSDEGVRNEFKTTVEFSILGIKKSKTFRKVSEEVDKNTYININAFQVGGDPKKLQAVLDSMDRTSCRLDDVDSCNRIMDRLIEYASSPDQFPAQAPTGILSYKTSNYYAEGFRELFFEPSAAYSAANQLAAESMTESYLMQTGYLTEANRVLQQPLKPSEYDAVAYLQRTILPYNISELKKALDTCLRFRNSCLDSENAVKTKIRSFDPDQLKIVRTFYHYCANASPEPSVARATNLFKKQIHTDSCLDAEQILKQRKDLELPGLGLTHLKFLRGAQSLKRLNVQRNQLTGIGGLAGLGDIQYLDVSSNALVGIQPIRDLTSLKELRIQNNGIREFSALPGLGKLEKVYAYGNDPLDASALLVLKNRGVAGLYGDDEACDSQGREAVRLHYASAADWELYKSINFAPDFSGMPSQAVTWLACEAALPNLYHNFEGLK